MRVVFSILFIISVPPFSLNAQAYQVAFDNFERALNFNSSEFNQVFSYMKQMNDIGSILKQKGSNPLKLKIGTFNSGMLDIIGLRVPKYEERVPFLVQEIAYRDFDILFIQELFNDYEQQMLESYALTYGYQFYRGTDENYKKHGMGILIKNSMTWGEIYFSEFIYTDQVFYEDKVNFLKGAIMAHFTLLNGQTISIYNTHLTATNLPSVGGIRELQTNELIYYITQSQSDYKLFGGDLNSEDDTDEEVYRSIVTFSQSIDLFRAVNDMDINGYTYDTKNNNIAKKTITGLFDRERIDYLMLSRTNPTAYYNAESSYLDFTNYLPKEKCSIRIFFRKKPCQLSDHFGITTVLNLFTL